MSAKISHTLARAALVVVAAAQLAGCNALSQLSEVGAPPKISQIQNPLEQASYTPISMPMPTPIAPNAGANSLWRPGARAFFKDQRASQVGDILTVLIKIADSAALNNDTAHTRDNKGISAGLSNFLGFETKLSKILPDSVDPTKMVDLSSKLDTENKGTIARGETINLTLAGIITQVLPNGNLVIKGRQEVRVNAELRELNLDGVVRPQDILASNTISYDKIAEARISYGGRGSLSNMQQDRWGTQVFDILYPF